MSLNKAIATAINEQLNHKGLTIELSNDILVNIKNNHHMLDLDSDNIEFYIKSDSLDNYLLLSNLRDMLLNDEIKINFTDKAINGKIDYINKLAKIK